MKALAILLWIVLATALDAAKPNILFIAVDDLRAELGCYGAEHIISPNIDKLAASGVRFDRAYCQQAICGPSRASVMTGLRPDSLGVHGNHTHFRDLHPDIVTLPQHFKNHGYHTQSMGKLYHGVFPPGSSVTVADTFGDEPSWSVPTFRPGPRYYYTEEGIAAAKQTFERMYGGKGDWTQKLVFGPATEAPAVEDNVLYDGQVAHHAVRTLQQLGAKRDQPFFLAVGFIKPHSPYIAPKKYWDLYDPEEIELAREQSFPDGAPSLAGHSSGELRRYTDQQKRGAIPEGDQRKVRHAYYACISYIDAQVGKVLEALEEQGLADETVVVLWSDHGYHLGEKGLWGKTTNYELDARVPLIVRAPGKMGNGGASPALVELVDLYPTLAELAGIPVSPSLEGRSLAPLLDAPGGRWDRAAYTQFTRGKRRGYSIATEHYRYVEWYETASAHLIARELYDHRTDPKERNNLAAANPGVARRLARLLDRGEGWRTCRERPILTVAPIFGDSMVLQRGKPVHVWGEAPAGEQVTVSFGDQSTTANADSDGHWCATLEPMPANAEGSTLSVRASGHALNFDEILVGEVWICAGQSNMRWTVAKSSDPPAAMDNLQLRLIDFTGAVYPSAKDYSVSELRAAGIDGYYATGGWLAASSNSVPPFSAVAYHFGAKLQRELGVPVGLIHNAIGGVPMESYIPLESLEADPALAPLLGNWLNDPRVPAWVRSRGGQNLAAWLGEPTGMRPHHPFEPGFLFEAGMRPLVPLAHAGFLWYQGESNATEDGARGGAIDPNVNERKFKTLITSWRRVWGDESLPFYFAQLPGLNRDWAPFRDVQRKVAAELDGVGIVVTLDLGHPTDVHPRAKKTVGERLAQQALAKSYGRPGIDPDGPALVEQSIAGGKLHLQFDKQLATSDGRLPRGFAISGEDGVFHSAQVVVSGDRLTLWAPQVTLPVAARYAWANNPDVNLTNSQGMLASPFRTDSFALVAATALAAEAAVVPEGTMSFEDVRPGGFTELVTRHGIWKAAPGHAEVNGKFAHTGTRSLHITGGDKHAVEFAPAVKDGSAGELTFRAERWTVREPFVFRVDALVDGEWSEIYRGDREIKVGARFLSAVRIVLPAEFEKLRFTCTAAKGGGILIDDVRCALATEMEVSVREERPLHPVLIGKKDNTSLRVYFDAHGSLEPQSVTSLQLSAQADRFDDIAGVRVLVDGEQFGEAAKPSPQMQFFGDHLLQEGRTVFEVCFELAPDASIDRRVGASNAIAKVGGKVLPAAVHEIRSDLQRIGVALRQKGQDGCDAYRIPGLATTNKGTLVAVYDNRYRGGRDLPGDIDVGMSRSTDGGQTWEPMKVIMDMGDDPKWAYDGIGDPAVLVDRQTNTIWVAATWSHGNRSWRGSGSGMTPEETGQLMLVKSEDDGLTWSEPINITRQIKDPKWRFVLQGPGKGITMKDGTLVFAAQFRGENEAPVSGKPFSTLIYSKDRGATWKIGTGVKIDTTEAQLVELGDGSIMINCRDDRGGARSVYTTKDLGATWQPHPTTRSALPEPVCMASLIRVRREVGKPLLFFSNPPQPGGRHHMTVKVSDDEGLTWPEEWHTLIDERFTAYSCMSQIGDDKIGLLYEGPGDLYFVRLPIAELVPSKP